MTVASSLPALLEAKRDDLVVDALAALPDSTYQALPMGEETLGGCLRAVTTAIRTRNPGAIRRWFEYETCSPSDDDLFACLSTTLDEVARAAHAAGTEISQSLRYLDWIRSEARRLLQSKLRKMSANMTGERVAVVDGLVRMMSVHDQATALHLDATGQLAERTACALGLDDELILRCRIGARLHDVGKIAVDRSIINKPSGLDESEWEAMCSHPVKGEEIIIGIPLLMDFAPIVRAHHERVDGTGYPDGLLADEIPLESRVIAVVDAFHAMTVPRPYRRAVAVSDALDELLRCAGKQFDPDIAVAFTGMFRRLERARLLSA